MAGVKSRLTQDEVKQLQDLLGGRQLSLLYKASVHGYNASTFHAKCDAQGPTVAIAYNGSGYIFGGLTHQSYVSSGEYIHDEKAFLFRLKGKEGVLSPLKIPVKTASGAIYDCSDNGPNFGGGALHLLNQNAASAVTSSNDNYTFNVADLHGNDLGLMECEVYRVEDISSFLESPWRKITWTTDYRTYPVKDGRDGKPLPIILCDTMGIEENSGAGLEIDEVSDIIKGHVPDRYQIRIWLSIWKNEYETENQEILNFNPDLITPFMSFNPAATLHPDSPGYIKTPSLKDQIHCVAFVIDGCKTEILPEKLEEKLKQLRRKVNHLWIPQLVLLTKVDEICPTLEEDVQCVYKSKAAEKQAKYGIVDCGAIY
ncbi:unnamed protein product [Natator depressus]